MEKRHQKVVEIRHAKPWLVRKTNRWNTLASWFAHHFIAVVLLPVHPPPSPTNQCSNGEDYLSPQDTLGASPILKKAWMNVEPKELPQDQGFKATKSLKMLLQRTVNWLIFHSSPIEAVWNPAMK